MAVVVTYNREQLLAQCDALAAQEPPRCRRGHRQRPTDHSGRVATSTRWTPTWSTSTNVGGRVLRRGDRPALMRHDADWVWVMDDAVPRPGALAALLEALALPGAAERAQLARCGPTAATT